MLLSRKFIFSSFQLYAGLRNSQRPLFFLAVQKLNDSCECRKKFQSSAKRVKDEMPPSASWKYESISEESSVILDVEEERKKVDREEIKDEFEGLNFQRGVSGVFDLDELVELLKKEKAQKIFVVRIPPEFNYADYMIIVNGKSKRHMLAVFEFIRKVFKKKMSPNDIIPKIEGLTSNDWMAIDLGNIIVHMFSNKTRNVYDLESLWSLGREYDPLSQKKASSESQVLSDYESILAKLIPDNAK